jgi:hypothetical protein
VEFQNDEEEGRNIEFYKDEEKSAVANQQNGLVCVKITGIDFYHVFYFFSSLGHGACPICFWKK